MVRRGRPFAFTAHLLEAGIDASIGTVGDTLDNALMESQICLYETELIKPRRPWHGLADVAVDVRIDGGEDHRLQRPPPPTAWTSRTVPIRSPFRLYESSGFVG